jgi:spermidine synthase
MLALGASGVSKLEKVGIIEIRRNQGLMIIGAGVVFLSMTYWNYINHLVRIAFGTSEIAFYGYFATSFLWMGLILFVVLGTMGRTLPLLFSSCRQDRKDIGGFIGTLYGLNTLGCVAGALLGGYLGLYFLNLDQIFRILMGLMLVTYILVSIKNSSWSTKVSWVAALGFILLAPSWNKEHMGIGLFRISNEASNSYQGITKLHRDFLTPTQNILAYKDGPSGTISIFENKVPGPNYLVNEAELGDPNSLKKSEHVGDPIKLGESNPGSIKSATNPIMPDPVLNTSRSIVVNGKSDGSTSGVDLVTTTLLAHLPALFSLAETGEAAVIGFGTGITVGNLAVYPNIKNIDVVEISSVVKDFAPYFKDFNLNAENNSKVNWITADAYRVFISSQKNYDVIVSEPSNPWVTGVERLYTQDFYKIVKERLAPGGVYAQWFHTYSISDATLGLVMNTYASVFPHIYTIRSSGGDLVILGSETAFSDKNLEVLEQRFYVPEVKRELEKIKISSPSKLIGFEVLNSAKAFFDQGLHLLDFPKLSYKAGKDFFKGQNADVERLTESLLNVPFNILASRDTVFSIFSKKHSSDEWNQKKKDLGEICVAIESAVLDPNWLKMNRLCRGAFFLAVREGRLKAEPNADNITTSLFQDFDPKIWTIQRAKGFIAGYVLVHSSLFPIPKDELIAKTEICQKSNLLEAVNCKFNLINALLVSGYFVEAESFLNQFDAHLRSVMRPEELESLKILEKRSKLAFSETSLIK